MNWLGRMIKMLMWWPINDEEVIDCIEHAQKMSVVFDMAMEAANKNDMETFEHYRELHRQMLVDHKRIH